MALRVLFLDKLAILFLVFAWACHPPTHSIKLLNVAKSDSTLAMQIGLLMRNQEPFTGTVFSLFDNGKDTAEVASYKNGREDGEWKKFYSATQIKEKRTFSNGQKTGEYLAWWENGLPQLHYLFKEDEYDGVCKEWNKDGLLIKEMTYSKGHEQGRQRWWYDNGKIKANYVIQDGRRYGLLGTKNCINVSDSVFNK